MDRLNKFDIFLDMIRDNCSKERKMGILFLCTDELKEEIKRMGIYKIERYITIRYIKGYAFLQVKCKNLNVKNIEQAISLLKGILITYSFDIVEYIPYEFDIDKVIDKAVTLVDVRKALGVNGQIEFADILGCTQPFLSLMEKGEKNLSKKAYITIKKLIPLMDLNYLYFK